MSTTLFTAAVFAGLILLSFLLAAVFLRLGASWAGIPGVTLKRAILVTLVICVVQLPVSLIFAWISPSSTAGVIVVGVTEVLLKLGIACACIAIAFKAGCLRSFLAWLATLIPALGMVALMFFAFCPFVLEAFSAPTNSMAPTLLGDHWQGICPRCGAPAFASPLRPLEPIPPEGLLMVCSTERRACRVSDPPRDTLPRDRFVVNKLIKPRRWDVILFRYPENPDINYMKRLAGLPGEEVVIRDGAVWINGRRLEPPRSIRGIEYVTEFEHEVARVWGDENNPAVLGPGEYFVLGDFSARALDSRLWHEGAPGHPPYAVPESYLIGVVTHIYWPPRRWRVLR